MNDNQPKKPRNELADLMMKSVIQICAYGALAHGATVPPEMLRGELPKQTDKQRGR